MKASKSKLFYFLIVVLLGSSAAIAQDAVNKDFELLDAAEKGDRSKVEELIASGADVNYRNKNEGVAPLHQAAQNGYLEIATPYRERSQC